MIARWLCLAAGFLAGGAARYLVATTLYARWGAPLYGTLAVNLSGCLLVGVFAGLAQTRAFMTPEARLLLMTGFCGAYTTFSALLLEVAQLGDLGQWTRAALYYLASGLGGLALVRLGLWLGASF